MIEERAKLARRQFERGVRSRGDVPVRFAKNDLYSLVAGGIFTQNLFDMRSRRIVVGDTKFPIPVNLFENRFDAYPKPFFFDVIDG